MFGLNICISYWGTKTALSSLEVVKNVSKAQGGDRGCMRKSHNWRRIFYNDDLAIGWIFRSIFFKKILENKICLHIIGPSHLLVTCGEARFEYKDSRATN